MVCILFLAQLSSQLDIIVRKTVNTEQRSTCMGAKEPRLRHLTKTILLASYFFPQLIKVECGQAKSRQ